MSKENNNNHMTYLKNYQVPDFLLTEVTLRFELSLEKTQVLATMKGCVNPSSTNVNRMLVLDGDGPELLKVILDGQELKPDDYTASTEQLIIPNIPESFTLELLTQLNPKANSKLSGLYVSNDVFCTQCESQGFRRIMYFLDRPDVMAKYTTEIIADKQKYPVLLSNGNLIETKDLEAGKHSVKWQDPFPKPCYLFALVAGDLACVSDSFTTHNAKQVALNIYVEQGEEDKCAHAMQSLKKAMSWDEQEFGREYDLDIFNIVAVSDFNMGAMENKSLNIFNSQYILARPDTATDTDYQHIESVIGHEYFHNWTGNRITCRDWFQLSLKEGLTIYRDQEFSRDMNSNDVMRINDVERLRSFQFAEDAGPLAHPVRPEAYLRIDNFYTTTVYEKGAEVIRMLRTIVGKIGFRKGMDGYFSRFDGQAVTIEEFVSSIEEANNIDLTQFRRWYNQSGTPHVKVVTHYDADEEKLSLHIQQHTPPTPGQKEKPPLVIPLKVALLDEQGSHIPLEFYCGTISARDSLVTPQHDVVLLTEADQTFEFTHVTSQPIVSILRDFSAPVHLDINYSDETLCFLMVHDDNGFSRWEAGQVLAKRHLQKLIHAEQTGSEVVFPDYMQQAYQEILADENIEFDYKAQLLTIPSESVLIAEAKQVDPDAFHAAHRRFNRELLQVFGEKELHKLYQYCDSQSANDTANPEDYGSRRLKQLCLHYLMTTETEFVRRDVLRAYYGAQNMTDQLGALRLLSTQLSEEREEALADFYNRWQQEFLIVNKWFGIQAMAQVPDALAQVKRLLKHPAFTYNNPNRIRTLIGAFSMYNHINFHAIDGSGYAFLAEQVAIIDGLNPQIAARLITPLAQWRKFDEVRAKLMCEQLEALKKNMRLSKDSYEIVSKSLV